MLDETTILAIETIELGKQAIIFAPSRASAEKTAEDIAKHTTLNNHDLEKSILDVANQPTKQCRRLSHCLKKGIAFHHAGLLAGQRDIIETNFRSGNIKIICATPTLAAGLSMPAYRVIIKSLKRYSGSWGMDWIPVLEYMQMSGRAGRPEYEKTGQAITIAKDHKEKEEIFDRYICGIPEDIYSKLAVEPVLRTYLLALISSGIIKDTISMNQFFQKTFWAHQYQDLPKLQSILQKMIQLLEEWSFIIVQKSEQPDALFIPASKLHKEQPPSSNIKNLHATLMGKRVSQLYLDPLTARHMLNCIAKYDPQKSESKKNEQQECEKTTDREGTNKQPRTSFSLIQMICHTLEMRPLLTIKSKEHDFIQEELNKKCGELLECEPNRYDYEYTEFTSSIKTALFFEDWINEKDEEFLLEKFDIKPGEIYAKIETSKWLFSAAAELASIEKRSTIARELLRIKTRVEYGVKEELLELLKLKGIGKIRARKLVNHHITDLKTIKEMPIENLTKILGDAIAYDIKVQLGEKPTDKSAAESKTTKSKKTETQQKL